MARNVTTFSLVQPANTYVFIVVTDAGISMEVIYLQSLKVEDSKLLNPLGREDNFSEVHP